MSTLKVGYGTKTAYTTSGVSSLASSSTFVAGYETNEIDNTSNLYTDFLIDGFITVGTTPTANTSINIYCLGSLVSLATSAKDVFDGTASAETLTNVGVGKGFLRLVASLEVSAATSNVRLDFGAISLASLFGGNAPPFHSLFVTHNTGVNLNATGGNHAISYQGVSYANV